MNNCDARIMIKDTSNYILIQTDVHALPVTKCNDPNPIISTLCVSTDSNLGAIFFWEIVGNKDKSLALKLYERLRHRSKTHHASSRVFGWMAVMYAKFFRLQVEYSGTAMKLVSPRKLLLKKARVIRDLFGVELIHYIVIDADEGNYDFYITEQTETQLSAIPINRFID
jgi:hypothetical protein